MPKQSMEENLSPKWFVMRAYKAEGRAEELLQREKVDYFIPKHYAVRIYHGVKSARLVPVIPSLVFVNGLHQQIIDFKKKYNFLQFITNDCDGSKSYLIVPNNQMNDFIKVASQTREEVIYYKPDEINIRRGTRVRIHGGQFDGVEGIFTTVKGKRNRRLIVQIQGIIAVTVEVHPDLVEVLR